MQHQQPGTAKGRILPEPPLALPQPVKVWTGMVAAILCAVMLFRFGLSPETPAFLALAVFAAVLGAVDLRTRLLPNALVLPFTVTALVLLTLASALSGEWDRLAGAALGSVAMFALYLALALISPGSLGMGDVKLAVVLGLYGGYAGMTGWTVTVLGGFVLGALISVVMLLLRRATRRSVFPFGPPMLIACVAGVLGFA